MGEIGGGDLLAAFEFDLLEVQESFLAAGHQEVAALDEQRAGRACGCFFSRFLRRRLTPNVARLAAEKGVGAGPGSEAAHAVEDFVGRSRPVDAAVSFF